MKSDTINLLSQQEKKRFKKKTKNKAEKATNEKEKQNEKPTQTHFFPSLYI